MTRLERCELAVELGYTYDPVSGKIFGPRGNEITGKQKEYIVFVLECKYNLLGHIFAWYCMYGEVVDKIDHKDRVRYNNCITNLRSVTHSENLQNNNAKGCYQVKRTGKWVAQIKHNKKYTYLGYFDTEQEARQAYLEAKEKYHITS